MRRLDVYRQALREQPGKPAVTDIAEVRTGVGSGAVGLRIRRLVALKIQRVPIWREG